ncbi:MAG: hypothetical protein JRI59_11590, partial [Deltaproteobacteria bacterium]|nr:hypothetical protein [Deltaproteobacteria bacterium]
MTAYILELWLHQEAVDQVAGEYDLTPGLTPEAALGELPPAVSQALAPHLEGFAAWHQGLLLDQELTGISRVRLYFHHRSAALPALAAGPWWGELLANLARATALYPGPQDTRLPRRFQPLAYTVAPLRHLLEHIRRRARQDPELLPHLLAPLSSATPDSPLDPLGQTSQLLSRFLARDDWRERDVFHLLLDFVEGSPQLFGEPLLNIWFSLKRLQEEDPPAYTRALAALINEGRGYLRDLPHWRAVLRRSGGPGPWDASRRDLVAQAVAGLLGVKGEDFQKLAGADGLTWPQLLEAAGLPEKDIDLKPLEKASLFLAAELFPEDSGQRRFLRHLLEQEEPYRRLLASVYDPPDAREAQLAGVKEAFNRHPANCESQVEFAPEEARQFLQVFFLRPDPVEAIIHREWRKDLYHTLKG